MHLDGARPNDPDRRARRHFAPGAAPSTIRSLVDGAAARLSVRGSNHNDILEPLPLLDAIPPVRAKRGRPRRRPRRLFGDGAYHSRRHRSEQRSRHCPAIPRPKQPHGSGVGTRTIAWLHQYRRLRVRYERRADIHEAFPQIAGCLICLKLLNAEQSFC